MGRSFASRSSKGLSTPPGGAERGSLSASGPPRQRRNRDSMIRVVTLRLYERRLEAPATPGAPPPGVELAVWDSPIARDAGWGHPEAEQRLHAGQACAVARHGKD